MKNNIIVILGFVLFIAVGCAELEVDNFNDANQTDVFKSASDVDNLPGGAFVSWHQAVSTVNTGVAMACNADVLTCSWGNFGIRNMSWEPRLPIDNSLTSNDGAAISTAYVNLYDANRTGIDLEIYLANPDNVPMIVNKVDVTAKIQATAAFLIGTTHAHLSMLYNQGFNADGTTDLASLTGETFSDYTQVRDFAVQKLEEAITIASANDFELPATYVNGLVIPSADLAKLASTIAAQAIALNARNPAENTAADWAKVLSLANAGITEDFAPIGDDNLWFDDNKLVGGGGLATGVIANSWARIDMKVINLMDPSYPTAYPAAGIAPEATTADQRISTDMVYNDRNFFPEDRGRYRFSNYIHNRYAATSTAWTDLPMPQILKAENDLMIAEAEVRTGGNKVRAAEMINNTRVGRGGLPALTGAESDQVMLDAIYYEKIIELMNSWGGRELCEVRRFGNLQEGSFEQLPVPGGELTTLGVPIYTFGGVQ